ncbi:DUF6907 domain-containing protein [Streptomyces sp. NPDC087226]|jgi:hypothetical protein|uniref:DUF6907 domain-containing protein n=1 Tax=Streptomyces sp. NPDC087226 TaxID=3365771 RepID=UPI00381F6F30
MQLPTAATEPSTRTGQRHGVTVAIGASACPLRHHEPLDLWATPSMDDVYAYEAVYNPSRISLADAETSVRTQLAEYGVQVAEFLNDDGPLTAQMRGAEWMARWSCPPWCISEHDDRFGMDWHSTALVETTLRDIDASTPAAKNARIPFLAARIVLSNDKAQAYGRETRVWLDYGTTTGELTAAKAREVLTAMRGFVTKLEAVVDQAEEIAKDDFAGDPEVARLDLEAEDRRIARRTAELEAKADAALVVARS